MIGFCGTASRVVLTYGRFDRFHQGHVAFLREIAKLGDEVIVGCATDAFAARIGRPCTLPYEERRALLQSCRYVSRVIPEIDPDQKRTDIVNYNAAALALGQEHAGLFDFLQDIAQVIYLTRGIAASSGSKTDYFGRMSA